MLHVDDDEIKAGKSKNVSDFRPGQFQKHAKAGTGVELLLQR